MNYTSLSISFRIGLAFHAMNNEGSSGTNVMEPRRISVGGHNYDGISGEMVRRHVLENFVRIAKSKKLPLSLAGEGLHSDRAKDLVKEWIAQNSEIQPIEDKGDGEKDGGGTQEEKKKKAILKMEPRHFAVASRKLLECCAIVDVGGFLAAISKEEKVQRDGKDYGVEGTLKRDSVFDVGWLISETPAIVEFSQHAAYRPDGQHNLFTQNMRAAVYGGVARLDLGRIGYNDWAWLAPDRNDLHLDDEQRRQRAAALLDAWEQWLLSPAGAKQAGWLQHTGQLEGILVLSNFGPAPFRSPIEVELRYDAEGSPLAERIKPNPRYRAELATLAEAKPGRYRALEFDGLPGLARAFDQARAAIGL
ncbi:DevR family CRISPR-associated autoregulator [Calidithermus timidus]|jgi:CRISPR-associated autoregulator DevR family|uniref:DevR family CRISPR-associated autoregulator n=1 Tax=Calidithermus timidus TaxID=307124 RepID=UPI000371D3E1|nr:DevR family CRISPR-associated autoregulator [Calidithermus timidus]